MGNCNRNLPEFTQKTLDISYLEKPLCYIGLIETIYGKCSNGILIDKNIVLTSAKILFDKDPFTKLPPNAIKFTPAKNGNYLPFGSIYVLDYYIHEKNETTDNWCILYLSKAVGYEINKKFHKDSYYKLCVFIFLK